MIADNDKQLQKEWFKPSMGHNPFSTDGINDNDNIMQGLI